ncbi:MAG: hypothetical protein EFKGCFLK_01488 [Rhodocyclaceae bacterium]|nr:MAG: FecR domain-containing protein [Rhodocyclaceae bacterium]MBE7421859.1 hypothetical protein [Zoogloeaceae bacterium]MBV6407920.1 hypothetical protein [Rhodocyclaceae bacterium]MCK6384384.1 FecR family protein [Rhodocyclaceae bacterium]CAG0934656.1 hypothetical protein RHDC3_02986 [Rhodocyclaceae bacterium]
MKPPSLSAACALLACTVFLFGPSGAVAQPVPPDGDRFATVWRLRGELTAADSSGAERTLREGDTVRVGDRVRAAASGEAVLKTADAGFVALRPGAEFLPERFSAEGKPSDSLTLRLVSGGLRVITGWIGRLNRSGHRIITPTATIGIRGTDHEPYVISAELAKSLSQREGTYDKVNRGGTTMDVDGNTLDIDAGKVGFVRAAKPFKSRALMTLLLPVLLDKVPDFYVPGAFDAELDRLAEGADAESRRLLEERQKAPPPDQAAAPAASETAPATASAAASAKGACDAPAQEWLARLDDAIVQRNARAVIDLFAPDAAIKAHVRGGDGTLKTAEFTRDELAQSSVDAMLGLQGFKQRRPVVEGRPAEGAKGCERVAVRSVSIEQGVRNGKPYRFESLEEYVIERRAGRWVAVRAETTQR